MLKVTQMISDISEVTSNWSFEEVNKPTKWKKKLSNLQPNEMISNRLAQQKLKQHIKNEKNEEKVIMMRGLELLDLFKNDSLSKDMSSTQN